MEKEQHEIIKKHLATVMPKLQEVLAKSELKDFSIKQMHLQFGANDCSLCPPGTCPWVDASGTVHFDCNG